MAEAATREFLMTPEWLHSHLNDADVRNYLGSWGEWGNREGLLIEHLTLPDPAKPA